jgi:hypothetical protein
MLVDWGICGVGLDNETPQRINYRNAEKILRLQNTVAKRKTGPMEGII